MRIIALPLTRAKISQHSSMLIFYHFDLVFPSRDPPDLSWHRNALKNVVNKATDIWTNLGNAPKDSWKLWTYELGERVADRVEFEELALRSVDPSLGPSVSQPGISQQVDNHLSVPKIPLIYPPSLYPTCPTVGSEHALDPALAHLETLLAYRGPRHRRGFYLWMLISPFTIPIALIPLIPNLPFFFCVWRSWSHYGAYRSSQYLSSLLNSRLIEPHPSIELDKLYTPSPPSSRTSQNIPTPPSLPSRSLENKPTIENIITDKKSEAESGTRGSGRIFITRKAIPLIFAMFGLPESAAVNMYRAVDQAHGRLRKSS